MNQVSNTLAAGAQVEDYSPYLERMHKAKKQAALAQLTAAHKNNVARLNREEHGLARGYQAQRNAAAATHEQQRRSFAEIAAANGLNSGTAGQAELARSVTLQNNLNDIGTAEASALADLTLKRVEAETEYNSAIAQAEYTGEHDLAAALYEEKVRVQEALIDEEIRRQQRALEQYRLQYQAQRDQVADEKEQRAQALKEKEQADSHALAQKKQADAAALDWAAQDLALQKYNDTKATQSRQKLVEYGELYLKAGVMPSEEMRQAMGITAADAHKYILALKRSQK